METRSLVDFIFSLSKEVRELHLDEFDRIDGEETAFG